MIIKKEKEFRKICNLKDLKENVGRRFMVDDVDVAVFKVEGKVYAVSNICPHQKSPIIHDAFLEEGNIVCPAHGWEFRLEDGKQPTGRNGLDSYEVKVENDEVYVKVYEKEWDW